MTLCNHNNPWRGLIQRFQTSRLLLRQGVAVIMALMLSLCVGISAASAAASQNPPKQVSETVTSLTTSADTVQQTPTPMHIAAQPKAPSALQALEAYRAGIKTIAGDFVQNSPQMGQSSGHFVFAQNGFFRWDVLKPHVQTILVSEGMIYQYDADLAQMTMQKQQFAKGTMPLQIIFGHDSLQQYFTIQDLGLDKGYNWVSLTPKDNDLGVKNLKIGLQLGVPFVVELTDFFGNVSTITFSHLKPNLTLSAADMRLDVPKNTSILNLGQ